MKSCSTLPPKSACVPNPTDVCSQTATLGNGHSACPENGTHVVSDRFTDATFAYQGGGRGVPLQDIATLEYWVQGDFRPDLTLLLDVPLEVSMARINQTREKDRFEQEEAEFFNRVREVYLQRANEQPERYAVIDSSQSLDAVKNQIETALDSHFGLNV